MNEDKNNQPPLTAEIIFQMFAETDRQNKAGFQEIRDMIAESRLEQQEYRREQQEYRREQQEYRREQQEYIRKQQREDEI